MKDKAGLEVRVSQAAVATFWAALYAVPCATQTNQVTLWAISGFRLSAGCAFDNCSNLADTVLSAQASYALTLPYSSASS